MAANSILFDNCVRVPADVFDLASFRRWATSDDFPEEGRISFLDGQLEIDLSPEDLISHGGLLGEVFAKMWCLVRTNDLGRVHLHGARLTNEVANISNEPDVMFCSWETLESGRVSIVESVPGTERYLEVVGTPDCVVEIVSNSSVSKDTRVLKQKYFEAGIDEYWLIDARKAEIAFQLLTRGESGYEPVSADRQGYRQSSVFPLKFKLTRQRDRIGHWRYTLLHRAAS